MITITHSSLLSLFDFPEEWSQAMIDDYNIECISNTDYETLLSSFEAIDLVETIPLVDAINACKFWINATDPFDATRISVRFFHLNLHLAQQVTV